MLSGVLADQSALYGVIQQLEALALELLEVRSQPAAELGGESQTRQTPPRRTPSLGERRPP